MKYLSCVVDVDLQNNITAKQLKTKQKQRKNPMI